MVKKEKTNADRSAFGGWGEIKIEFRSFLWLKWNPSVVEAEAYCLVLSNNPTTLFKLF